MFRYFIANILGKASALALKIMKRRIPYYPGYIALKICPDYLKYVKKPKTIIAVTGTNGKSTLCGILNDYFTSQGLYVINNKGFNIETGIAAMFLSQKRRADVAIIEIDEQTTDKLFKYITPTYYICTNLFRDSMKNNSNIDYNLSLIKNSIPQHTKLVLNADDLYTVALGEKKDNIYFGISSKYDHGYASHIFSDLVYCPKCGSKLHVKDTKYFHIGNVECLNCGYTNPTRDYDATISLEEKLLYVSHNGKKYQFPLAATSIFNIYNYLAAISVILELGYSEDSISKFLSSAHLIQTRYRESKVGNLPIIVYMAKGQNPVACSSVFNDVTLHDGKKCLLLMLDDVMDRRDSTETISWYYDTDFELFNNKDIERIIISGARSKDVYVRMLLAGVDKEKISVLDKEEDMASVIPYKDVDKIFVLHDITLYDHSCMVVDKIKEMGEKLW